MVTLQEVIANNRPGRLIKFFVVSLLLFFAGLLFLYENLFT